MIKNYLTIAVRNILRHKGYSAINIAGLAIGMACCMLMMLWVNDELSYDRFHDKADQLYRVVEEEHLSSGRIERYSASPAPLGPVLEEQYPEIIGFARYKRLRGRIVSHGDRRFVESGVAFADQSLLELFTFPTIRGDSATALSETHKIVLTESTAERYFGNGDAVGQTLTLDNNAVHTVSAVIEDVPGNSHLGFDFLIPFENIVEYGRDIESWDYGAYHVYVELSKSASLESVEPKIADIIQRNVANSTTSIYLQPVTDIHLYSGSITSGSSGGGILYVYAFSTAALLVLIIACLNFVNLTTARAPRRAKEVGLRKTVGANRRELAFQMFGETVLMTLVAMLLAVALVEVLLPLVESVSQNRLSLDQLGFLRLAGGLLPMALVAALLAGSYPAIFLSSFNPGMVLRASPRAVRSGGRLRQILVTGQFVLSVFLIVTALVIYSQLNFMRSSDVGYDTEYLVTFKMMGGVSESYESLKAELLRYHAISDVTVASDLPTWVRRSSMGFSWPGKDPEANVDIFIMAVDPDYLSTMGLNLVEGRFFSEEFLSDEVRSYVLNQKAVQLMDVESPVGMNLSWDVPGQVIGVVEDFHYCSKRDEIKPLVMMFAPDIFSYMCVRIAPDDVPAALTHIEKTWNTLAAGCPFEYSFLDESLDSLYHNEERVGILSACYAVLAIIVACMGLLGLAASSVELRTREIGIRKALGASVARIVSLLLREWLILLSVANLIAWPLAYFIMNRWLENFAYRIDVTAGMFVLSGSLAVVAALASVGHQVIRAARANPVEALKYE